MAQLKNKPCAGDWTFFGDDCSDRHERQFAALQAASAKVDPDVSLVGALVHFPWADGAAYYRVAKDKPLMLEHVPVHDAWSVSYAQIRGLRRADVVAMVAADNRMAKLLVNSPKFMR